MLRVAVAALPVLLAGCFDEPPLPETGLPVFLDAFTTGFTPNSFDPANGADVKALSIDKKKSHSGTSSIRLEVPASVAGYAGGTVLADKPQDLSETNALYFWATSSRAATFDQLGFGNDFGALTYQALLANLPLTTEWTRHLIPVPDPSRLKAELGVFWYADADPAAYTAWFDDVKFDYADPASLALESTMADSTATVGLNGDFSPIKGLTLRYNDLDGVQRAVDSAYPGSGPAPAYFNFLSSNPSVAGVDADGKVYGLLAGQSTITARLAKALVAGSMTVTVGAYAPATLPPAPTLPAASVIALLAKPYTAVPVDNWGASWSNGNAGPRLTELSILGEPMKKYSNLQYVGIEFVGNPAGAREIDAAGAGMTAFHIDVWSPDATVIRVKLVDFGADKISNYPAAGDDSQSELTFNAVTVPAVVPGQWLRLDLPLSSFTGLASTSHLAQLVVSATNSRVFIDNVYFHK